MHMSVPAEALQTPCISECRSTVLWEYDAGEPMTRWHPGTPDYFEPVRGCEEAHLEMLTGIVYAKYTSELYRQLEQWGLLCDAARLNERSSREYLGVKRRRLSLTANLPL